MVKRSKYTEDMDHEWDVIDSESVEEYLYFQIKVHEDVKRIYGQLNNEAYRRDRFSGRHGEEDSWERSARSAYRAKLERIAQLNDILIANDQESVTSLKDALNRHSPFQPMPVPEWLQEDIPVKTQPMPSDDVISEQVKKHIINQVRPVSTIEKPRKTKLELAMEAILTRLKEARENLGLSQIEASAMCGFNSNVIGGYETGASRIRLEDFVRMCQVCECDMSWVLTGTSNTKLSRELEKMKHDVRNVIELLSGAIE